MNFKCKTCENHFTSNKADKNRTPKYCSKSCFAESLRKYKECKQCGKSFADFTKDVFCSQTCQYESRKGTILPPEWRKALSEGRKKSDKCKGENLYNWKGGKETEAARMKQSFYKRKANLSQPMPTTYLAKVLQAQECKCFYCECDLTDYKAIEHLTPVSRGGDNHPYNLVYSCKSCNSTKRQKTLEEFAIENERFDLIDKFDNVYASAL